VIFDLALREDRVVVSLDTDFGTILARRMTQKPSLILFRRKSGKRPEIHFDLLLKNLSQISQALEDGSVVVFEQARIRVRQLPISD
jgi:predicted nuclease of predicted toxin-antitoxin system